MQKDDRKEFEQQKIQDILELSKSEDAYLESKEIIKSLDKFNYTYLWSWMGLPIIQWPADIMATQEIIWKVKPDFIIETGVARGGSMVFMASMLQLLGKGEVIGVDIEIRKHNRIAIEEHPNSKNITLIEGPSTSEETLRSISDLIPEGAKVLVILDSDHSYQHVLEECRLYSKFVSKDSYLIVADTIVGHMDEDEISPNRSKVWFRGNEPLSARNTFLTENEDFIIDEQINGKLVLSSSPGGYLLKVR